MPWLLRDTKGAVDLTPPFSHRHDSRPASREDRKKTPAGIMGPIVKDEHAEHGDALGYALGTKHPIPKLIERPRKMAPRRTPITVGADRSWMTT